MTSSWLPTGLELVGVVVFVAVVFVHVLHAVAMSGRARLWHSAHVLMALGMVDMYWPASSPPVRTSVGEVVFVLATLALLAFASVDAARRHPPLWLALITGVDLAAMVYMFAMTRGHTYVVLSALLVAWFGLEAVGWLSGGLSTVAWRSGLGLTVRRPAPIPDLVPAGGPARRRAVAAQNAESEHDESSARRRDPVFSPSIKVTLALMTVGMGYMILAMQWGMPSMPGTPAMPMHGTQGGTHSTMSGM